jgi:uncharacterized membrane protein YjjP (DUF1212 family)
MTATPSRPTPLPVSTRGLAPTELADYLSEIGVTLLAYGCPSYRLEDVIMTVAREEGFEAEAFAIPTALFVSLRREGQEPINRMTRVRSWDIDLGKLAGVDAIFNAVADNTMTVPDARRRLRALVGAPPPYPWQLRWLAVATSSGAAAVFFRGRLADVLVSAGVALVIHALARWVRRVPQGRFLVDFAGGLTATLSAWLVSQARPDLSREVVVLAGAIALVPGMTLTTGLAELAQKNLVSGASRLMEAFITFLSIVSGIASGVSLEKLAEGPGARAAERVGLALPWQIAAMAAASLAFSVLFAVPWRYVGATALSGAVGWAATGLATRYLPGHVAAFVASLAVGVFANACARSTQRPAQVFQLPGLMLLVPGSFGFLSLEEFLRGRYVEGAEKGFAMLLIAGGLVMGVLAANVMLPARKLL